MRRVALLLLFAAGILALFLLHDPLGDVTPAPEDLPRAPADPSTIDVDDIRLAGRGPFRSVDGEELPQEFVAALVEVRSLLEEGKASEALALLAVWRTRLPHVFERPENARFLLEIEAEVAREAARTQPAPQEAGASRWQRSRTIAGSASSEEARTALERHVDRFVPREDGEGEAPAASTGVVEAQLDALLADRTTWRSAATPLPVADTEAKEARRVEQLERLAGRGATELLDPLHAALVWLALHQADDGRFGDEALTERCKALGHDQLPRGKGNCLHEFGRGARKANALPATALALMAFLDFRDQDARGVFEPHIARGLSWLRAQQNEDGTFKTRSREYYATALALMALGQAAASSGSKELRRSLERGLARLYTQRGPNGGYRYGRGQPGDVSVSGWIAQAVEAARWAGAEVPDGMAYDLRLFLEAAWLGEERFNYTVGRGPERPSLFPAGMLMGTILWEEVDEDVRTSWRTWLRESGARWPARPWLYTLYYGVRVSLLLEGGLGEPWAGWLHELLAAQCRVGGAAGMFPRKVAPWTEQGGICVVTALAALTLEHALYAR